MDFIIPGIAAILLQMFAIVGISTTIVRERELGGAEQLLATPIRPLENILGKVVPYLGLSFLELLMIHAIGYFWFGVPFKGSLLLYAVLSLLFVVSSLSIGMFISIIATNQNQIQHITALILLLSFLLTGLVFSRIPMPLWTKIIGDLLPMTHFLPIVRGVLIKGVGIDALWVNVGALGAFCVFMLLLLPAITRKRLD